jgi:glycosyltransferase involved in cell wall biosynthesis
MSMMACHDPLMADVTVVIPTHNRQSLLPETIDSVLRERSVDLEVIVVDDNSEDGTIDFLQSHPDSRLRPIRLSPGRGGSAARNVGLSEVRTPYVMFLDDDDLVRAGAIPRLLSALEKHPAAILSGGAFITFGGARKEIRQMTTRFTVEMPFWREELWGWNIQPGAGIWRTPVVRDMGGWDESLGRCEDLDINLRTYDRPAVIIPGHTVLYRWHPGQIDPERRERERALDIQVRTRFVATLPSPDREVGEGILAARPKFHDALEAYKAGDFRRAAGGFVDVFRTAPYMRRSPILSPWLYGLLAKATAASMAPNALKKPVRRFRQDREARRLAEAARS